MLYMVSLQYMEGISELWLKLEGSSVKAKLRVEWPSLAIQITLNG